MATDEADDGTVTGNDDASKDCCAALEDALEMLGRISALADQAEAELAAVPYPVGERRRAATRRLDAFVVATAQAAREALGELERAGGTNP